MNALWQDLRYAVRMMRKAPGATLFAIVALALGIGVTTSVFCILANALWRPLPVARTEEVVAVVGGREEESGGVPVDDRFTGGLSYADYADLRDRNEVFSGLAGSQGSDLTMSTTENRRGGGNDRTDMVPGEFVTGNYFDVFEVHAALGRTFLPEEDLQPNGAHVIVLSHSLWKRHFNGDPAICGRTVYFDNEAFTVIGVAPPAFRGISMISSDFWIPIMAVQRWNDEFSQEPEKRWTRDRTRRDFNVLGRLRPQLDIATAQANLQVLWRSLVEQYPKTNRGATVDVVPQLRGRYGKGYDDVRLASILAQAVACLVLLVACSNVANLILARATGRTKEIAIRQALGASRGRLVRQLMTESLALAILGGAAGLLVASWCGDLFVASLPTEGAEYRPSWDVAPDLRAFGVALGVSLFTGIAFGLAPSLRTSRVAVVESLKTDSAAKGQSLRHFELRHALVVAQLSISMVVVVTGALFVRSLRKIEAIDAGYRPDNVVSVLLDPGMLDYRGAEVDGYFATLLHRLETVPGVQSAAISSLLPLNGALHVGPIVKEGDPPALPNQGMEVTYNAVGAKYFETIGSDLVAGRDFRAVEHDGSLRTAIVNQEMARRLFGDEQKAIGKRFRAGSGDSPFFEVVGVARDGKYVRLTEEPRPHMFLPRMPADFSDSFLTGRAVLVRAASPGDLPFVLERMREEIHGLDARVAIAVPLLGDEHFQGALYFPRVAASLGMALGFLTLFLSAMGVYGVMAYGVSQRTREIGIRMAIGGQPRDVLRLVMQQGLALVLIGLALGSVGAYFAGRVASGFLYGVGASDPLAFVGTIALLVLVALAATFIPARRATRVDPMVALRYE